MAAKKNNLPKFHAKIYSNIDSFSLEEHRGIIYTSGFEKGSDGYLVNAINGDVSKLRVTRSLRYSLASAQKIPEGLNLAKDEFLVCEFVYQNYINIVWFKNEDCNQDSNVLIPAHELISIS